MQQLIESFADQPELIVVIVGIVFGSVVVIATASYIYTGVVKARREIEQSRRELAAYVAEGTLSADDAERLLAPSPWFARSARHVGAKFWQAGPGGCPPTEPKA